MAAYLGQPISETSDAAPSSGGARRPSCSGARRLSSVIMTAAAPSIDQALAAAISETSDAAPSSGDARRLSSSGPVRKKSSFGKKSSFSSFLQKNPPKGGDGDRVAADDAELHPEFFGTLLYESLEGSKLFVFGCIAILVAWASACAFFSEWLRELSVADPGGRAERWLEDMENSRNAVSVLGTLFVFSLVFRFNTCYDRWWEARIFWWDIISNCLNLAIMNRRWVADPDLNDKLSRFIIAYAYAVKALLRGSSLGDPDEDGQALVDRGILTPEELQHMHTYPCWQPHYCIDMIRAILVEAHKVPGGKGLTFDEDNKIHGQMFRCFDGVIKLMIDKIGDSVRTRASGLPASYDAITMTSFFVFFALASVAWSAGMGWMTPIMIGCSSFIVMLLIVMGSKLVDPFGHDNVDVPMEAFCATVEAQVHAIDERARSGIIEKFARTSRPRAMGSEEATVPQNIDIHVQERVLRDNDRLCNNDRL